MKTFESQLLELLREYRDSQIKDGGERYNPHQLFNLPNLLIWLSKRVEKEEEKETIKPYLPELTVYMGIESSIEMLYPMSITLLEVDQDTNIAKVKLKHL
jgi:hypothetical protein